MAHRKKLDGKRVFLIPFVFSSLTMRFSGTALVGLITLVSIWKWEVAISQYICRERSDDVYPKSSESNREKLPYLAFKGASLVICTERILICLCFSSRFLDRITNHLVESFLWFPNVKQWLASIWLVQLISSWQALARAGVRHDLFLKSFSRKYQLLSSKTMITLF